MPASFPPEARLHRPPEYVAALKGRRIARGNLFVLVGNRPAEAVQARLGMVIPKRHVPLAVARNAIKRVLRESFRHHRAGLPAGDFVFRLVSPPGPAGLGTLKRMVRREADTLLARVARC